MINTDANRIVMKKKRDNQLERIWYAYNLLKDDYGNIYTVLNKFAIYVSTSGSSGCWCTIQGRTETNRAAGTDTWVTFAEKASVTGWSGWNIINTTSITTHGNQNSHYAELRFTFGVTSHPASSAYPGLTVQRIMGFGGVGWTTPSNMAKHGHMYTYDYNQNVTFPAAVTATSFSGNGASLTSLNAGNVSSGTLAVARGGTGQTTLEAACNSLINGLTTGSSVPTDADYYVCQYASGGTTTTTYHRRPVSKIYEYVQGKTDARYLKLTGGTLSGALTVNGAVTGTSFTGDGSALTALNASNISSGTLNAARLPTSGVTAGTYGQPDPITSLSSGEPIYIPYITVDNKGRVTAIESKSVELASFTSANSYHTRVYSSGLKISTGTGVSDMYVPTGTASQYGVVKPAAVRTSAITSTTGGTTSNRYYGVELDSDGKMFVNVPWSNSTSYLPLTGGTVTGTLTLSKTQDLSGTANNSPALIVGGAATSTHLELDCDEIQAKTNGTSTAQLYINRDGGCTNFGGGITVTGNIVGVADSTGYATISGFTSVSATNFIASSDKRLKTNIKDYTSANSILDLPVKEFDFTQTGQHSIGCIAQDLQELFPELVSEKEDGYLGIQESKLVYLLLLELKKLNAKVVDLESKLAD